jgi:hypothetical protein
MTDITQNNWVVANNPKVSVYAFDANIADGEGYMTSDFMIVTWHKTGKNYQNHISISPDGTSDCMGEYQDDYESISWYDVLRILEAHGAQKALIRALFAQPKNEIRFEF